MNLQDETARFMQEIGLSSEPASGSRKSSTTSSTEKAKGKPAKKANNAAFVVGRLNAKTSELSRVMAVKNSNKKDTKRVAKTTTSKEKDTSSLDAGKKNDTFKSKEKKVVFTEEELKGDLLHEKSEDMLWYTAHDKKRASLESTTTTSRKLANGTVDQIMKEMEIIFAKEAKRYQKKRNNPATLTSDQKMMQDMIRNGTISDKIASMSLVISESPVHNLDLLDSLIHLATTKEQRTANLALEAIKDLLIHNLLPDRHLVPLSKQSVFMNDDKVRSAASTEEKLLYYFEDKLIARVGLVIDAVEQGLKSSVDHFKKQCMVIATELLSSKPEQEARLLVLLVNKLGDPNGNVCSKCIELLKQTMKKHPAMKLVILKEVDHLIRRHNAPTRTVYNGIVFLNQVSLHSKENAIAAQLMDMYISLFENAVKKEELRARLLSGILSGINKAFPFLKDGTVLEKHTDELFTIVHGTSFNSATQALILISHMVLPNISNRENVDLANRFYRALYTKIMSEQVLTKTRNTQFLNLIFRSIKKDSSDARSSAFLKRLALCSTHAGPPIAAGLLLVISEVCKVRPTLVAMLDSDESMNEEDTRNWSIETKSKEESKHNNDEIPLHMMGPFDGMKREPLYACATRPSMWEVSLLRNHYHPSVQKFATSLLDTPHEISFNGDPTTDFTLNAFLNRFAFKNPKTTQSHRIRRSLPTQEQPLNNEDFIFSAANSVEPDKLFFHKFFGERNRLRTEGKARTRSNKKRKDDENENDVDIDDFDGGHGDEDVDSDFDSKEIDKFADKLAMKMMDDYADRADQDSDDMDDFDGSDDDDDDDDEGNDVLDLEDFKKQRSGKGPNGADSDSDSDPDFDARNSDGSDSEDEEFTGLMAYGDEAEAGQDGSEDGEDEDDLEIMDGSDGDFEEEEEEEEEVPMKKRKAGRAPIAKNAKKSKESDFAQYTNEFESMMEENMMTILKQREQSAEPVKDAKDTPAGKKKKKITKKGK